MEAGTRNWICEIKKRFVQRMQNISEKLEGRIIKANKDKAGVVYGPVPSRRLGRSLGINHIKRKYCSYDCIYCQAGETDCCSTKADCCLSPYDLYFLVKHRLDELNKNGVGFDYISFVPNGEPTIDPNLGKHISLLREFGYKIAVFTNASLLWNENVRERLLNADYVSVKIDTLDEGEWVKINRPHKRTRFNQVLDGIRIFSNMYQGTLTTETMLIKDMNDNTEEIRRISEYLKKIRVDKSYFAIPIRPPSEEYVKIPNLGTLEMLKGYIMSEIQNAEMLCCPEGSNFNIVEEVGDDVLGITAVHPIREESMIEILRKKELNLSVLDSLLELGRLKKVFYNGETFYLRGV